MNDFRKLHLRENDFHPDKASSCELLIKLSFNRLSYSIINTLDKQIYVLYDSILLNPLTDLLEELFKDLDYFSFTYKDIKISIETFDFTFIPEAVYTRSSLDLYLNSISVGKGAEPFITSMKSAGSRNIFAADQAMISPLTGIFPAAKIYTQAEPLIEGALNLYGGAETLFLQFNSKTFEALVLSADGLVYYNIFSIDTVDDFNYFLLFVMQEMELNSTNIKVIVAGLIDVESDYYKRMERYFQDITFADTPAFRLSAIYDKVSVSQFFSLFSLSLCE